MPWLPVFAPSSGLRSLSDRFLHDFRSTISDLYAENHWLFAKRVSDLGLTFSTEGGYGWASAIADGLRIEAFADVPMGEFGMHNVIHQRKAYRSRNSGSWRRCQRSGSH